jgi:hypothetical protein
MHSDLPLLFVRYTAGSAGRFLVMLLQTSDRLSCWNQQVDSARSTPDFNSIYMAWIRDSYRSDLSRHLYHEPKPDCPLHEFFSASHQRGNDIDLVGFVQHLKELGFDYTLEAIQHQRPTTVLVHKSQLPRFGVGNSVINVVVDPASRRWLHRVKFVKGFKFKQGSWITQHEDPDVKLARFGKITFANDYRLPGSQFSVIRNYVINDPNLSMFTDANAITADPSNQFYQQQFIELSDLLDYRRLVPALERLFDVLDLGAPKIALIKDIWDHYYQTNIAPFNQARILDPAKT